MQWTMHDLTAQVTSSLLPFPGVTVDALGEDDIALDSVLQGNFTVGKSSFTDQSILEMYIFLGL